MNNCAMEINAIKDKLAVFKGNELMSAEDINNALGLMKTAKEMIERDPAFKKLPKPKPAEEVAQQPA